LVLAFACAFTMFASAAFTDQADIKVKAEAVDTLVQLGVINGYTDGSFKPNDTVTRAEMAKMIYVLRTGNSDASAYNDDKTSFTDIGSHWARGYIKYCQSLGIIAGKSNTKFVPNDKVTAQEAAKMLLVTLGYDANKAGLVGVNWTSRTNALADENGLLEDVNTSFTGPCPRQYAAQLIYNAIDTPTVVWRDDAYTNTNYKDEDNKTIGEKYMGLTKFKAANGAHNNILTKVEKEDGRDTYSITVNGKTFTRVVADYTNLIGQDVVVMAKDKDTSKVFGVYAAEDSKVLATGFVGQLEKDGTEKIKLDGKSFKFDDSNPDADLVYEINTDTKAKSLAKLAAAVDKNASIDKNVAAQPVKLIDNNGDGKIDAAIVTPVKVGQVSAVTKTSVTIKGVKTVKFDDDTIYDGVKKDDYVCYVADVNNSSDGAIVTKLDATAGKVSGKRTHEAQVDSTWYKTAGDVSVDTNSSYDFVIVGGVVLFADETEGSVKNVAYIGAVKAKADTIVGDNDVTVKVRMYFPDKTDAEVKVSKIAGTKLKKGTITTGENANVETKAVAAINAILANNGLVTYSKLSDGTYDIKAVSSKNLAGTDAFVDATTKNYHSSSVNGAYYDSKINKVSVDDEAVIYVKTANETKVLTGKQLKNWDKTVDANLKFTAAYLAEETNGINYVKVAALVADKNVDVPGSKDAVYAYAVTDVYTATVDGEDKDAVQAWNGTKVVTLYADGTFNETIKAGDLFSYKENGNYIEKIDTHSAASAAVIGFDGKAEGEITLKVAGSAAQTYTLDEDVVVYVVKDGDHEGVADASISSIVEAGYNKAGDKRIENVKFILGTGEDNDKVVAIIIDEDNELDNAKEV
ncbi:S-layer homology domain-containing protein, partial [Agathobaculum butyriciproducens]